MVNQGCMCRGSVGHSVMFPNGCQTELCTDRAFLFIGRNETKQKTHNLSFTFSFTFLKKALIQISTYENVNNFHSDFSSLSDLISMILHLFTSQ